MRTGKWRDPARGRWLTLSALAFPVIFFAVVATGLYSMMSGRMSLFRPATQQPAGTAANSPTYPDRPQAPAREEGAR
jgi:hypothetical protein